MFVTENVGAPNRNGRWQGQAGDGDTLVLVTVSWNFHPDLQMDISNNCVSQLGSPESSPNIMNSVQVICKDSSKEGGKAIQEKGRSQVKVKFQADT